MSKYSPRQLFSNASILCSFIRLWTHILLAKPIGFIHTHTPVRFWNDRQQSFPHLQYTFRATSLPYTLTFVHHVACGRTRKIFVKYVLFTHDSKYTQYRTENVKYISGMPTNINFCTNISGGAFSTLVDLGRRWRTSIITGANCRGLKDEKNWQQLSTKISVLTGICSGRDPAS